MKVVLFCGGLGTRLREYSETIPKPLVPIGPRPIIWHLMRYYAHYGHKEFILCLGYRGEAIKEYFLDYRDWESNDFVLRRGREVEMASTDIDDWEITFVNTGQNSNVGERLLAVKSLVENDEAFLANYSDGLTDLPLDDYIEDSLASEQTASLVAVRSPQSFHSLSVRDSGRVEAIGNIHEDVWINGGFFCFRPEIFEAIRPGEELVEEPFQRLIRGRQLRAHRHQGFWRAMDTFKDKMSFESLYERGEVPWQPSHHVASRSSKVLYSVGRST